MSLGALSCISLQLSALSDVKTNDYNEFISRNLARTDHQVKVAAAVEGWKLYSCDMRKVKAFQTVNLESLLSQQDLQPSADEEYNRWLNVLGLVRDYNELRSKVFPEIPNGIDDRIKILIARTSWIIFVSPLIPQVYESSQEIFAFRSETRVISPNSNKRRGKLFTRASLKKCFKRVHRVVHMSNIGVNLVSNIASSIREVRFNRSINSANQFATIARTFAPNVAKTALLMNRLLLQRKRTIPPIQYIALGLQLTDFVMNAIESYLERIND